MNSPKLRKISLFVIILVTLFSFNVTSCKRITEYSLTIFATNDLHGQLIAMPAYSTIINKVRDEKKNVLLLDAGDFFKRGPYESYHGKIEIEMFNAMKYDAIIPGNNEFKVPGSKNSTAFAGSLEESDNQIKNIISWAKFPVLCGNVKLNDTGKYIDGTKPYIVKRIGGIKIGIIGIANSEPTAESLDMGKNKKFISGELAVKELLPEVKKNSDIQIVLSHAGMNINRQIGDVSAIISGHDHMILQPPEMSGAIPITQAGGENDHYLYRLDLDFKLENGEWVLKNITGKLDSGIGVERDTTIEQIIDSYTNTPIPTLYWEKACFYAC
ncbi:MAG: metallophosphoesterase [Saccharofermentanales bacterium]